jgi:hypothetical protein
MKISELEKGKSTGTSITLPETLLLFGKELCDRQDTTFSKKFKMWLLQEIENMPIKEVAAIAEKIREDKNVHSIENV